MKRFLTALVVLASLTAMGFAAPVANYVLVHNAPLYLDNADKTLKYITALTLGDAVTLMNKTATFKESGSNRDFTRIKTPDGKEGWIRTQYLAVRATLAVMTAEDALIFSEPRDVKVTGRTISRMTVVAVMQEGSVPGFSRVSGWDPVKGSLFTDVFMFPSDISTVDADVQSAVLFTVAQASKDAAVKKNLLKVALGDYPGSIFYDTIDAVLNGNPVPVTETATSSPLGTPITVKTSSTLPAEKSGSYSYEGSKMFDGNPLTAWAEASSGGGEGETIEVTFSTPLEMDQIEFMPGFFDARWFQANVRVKEMKVQLYDAAGNLSVDNVMTFEDKMIAQRMDLQPTKISRAVFTVQSVYDPDKEDLSISEISFWNKGSKLAVSAKDE